MYFFIYSLYYLVGFGPIEGRGGVLAAGNRYPITGVRKIYGRKSAHI